MQFTKVGFVGVAISGLMAIPATGCNKSSTQLTAQEQQAQQIVAQCITKGNVLTAPGRKQILTCVAPPGHEQQFQTCAADSLTQDKLFTKAQRQKWYGDVANCLEKNR